MKENKDTVVIKGYLDRAITLLGKLLSYEENYSDRFMEIVSTCKPSLTGEVNRAAVLSNTTVYLNMLEDEDCEEGVQTTVFQTQYGKVVEFRPGEWINHLEEMLEYEIPLEECVPIDDYDFFKSEDEEECDE